MATTNPYEAALAADLGRREHSVTIDTRYGETTRKCYCSATQSRSHHEDDTPWLSDAEEAALPDDVRTSRRFDYRMHLWIEDDGMDGLLGAIPREQCGDHDNHEPGSIHWYRAGHDQTVTICIPEEDVR